MLKLKEQHCRPLEEGATPMTSSEIELFGKRLPKDWEIDSNQRLYNSYSFENFNQCMAFAQEIARIAAEEEHHPDLHIHYSGVEVELRTHAIEGLSENDFIMAAKISDLWNKFSTERAQNLSKTYV